MNDFEAYKLYLALKRHFTSDSYDFFKYNGKIKANPDSFQKRKDKVFFQKLAKHSDLQGFLVSNFIINEKLWVRELAYSEECEQIFKSWLKRQQQLTYTFKNQLQHLNPTLKENLLVRDNQHPELLIHFLQGMISIETFCILLKLSGVIETWDAKMEYDPVWSDYSLKVKKYSPFISYDKKKIVNICIDYFKPAE